MTEVPEKETEGAPRRRRTSRAAEERQRVPVATAAAAEAAAHAASLVAMPGERLSRAADGEDEIEGVDGVDIGDGGDDAFGDAGQRRRRRRGGRGRGRGRRDETGQPLEAAGVGPAGALPGANPVGAGAAGEEDEEFDEPQPANLPHHTFGSVWDSQIGVPASGSPAVDSLSGGEAFDEDDLEEPEVPEYLLAERRQRGGGGRQVGGRTGGRPQRGRSAYQVALDRERYGSAGAPRPAFGSTSSTGGGRSPQGGRDRGRGGRPAQGGTRPPMRAPRMDDRPRYEDTPRSTSAEPWSEVPPELEQMLRAEMSRKAPAPSMSEPMAMAPTTQSEPEAAAKPVRRTRTTKATTTDISAEAVEASAAAAPAKTTRSRTTKASTTKSTTTRTRKAAPAGAEGEAAPKKPATRTRKAAAPSDGAPETTASIEEV